MVINIRRKLISERKDKKEMRSRLPIVTASCMSILLMLVSPVVSLTLVPLDDRAGLPYPEEGYEDTVYLKEASVTLDIDSTWAEVPGYRRWPSVTIYHRARYIFENVGDSTAVAIKIPIAATAHRGLTFKLDGQEENFTDVEHVEAINELGARVTIGIYTLAIAEFSAQTQRTVEVEVEQSGAALAEAQYIYLMKNASRWTKPIEEFSVTLNLRNADFGGSTIDPTTQRTDGATWNMTNLTPSSDLILYWQIREPPEPLNLPLVAVIIIVAILVTTVVLKKRLNSSSSRTRLG